MDRNTLFEANALIESITDPKSAFFEAAQASRLIDILPVAPLKRHFKFRLPWISDMFNGFSPGVGNVGIGDGKKEKEFTIGGTTTHAIGGYKVTHTPGEVYIERMWAHTQEDLSGQSCLLSYNETSKAPEKLEIAVSKVYDFFIFSFENQGWQAWKTPRPAVS